MSKKRNIILIISLATTILLILTVIYFVFINSKNSTNNINNSYKDINIEKLNIKIEDIAYNNYDSQIKIKITNNSKEKKYFNTIKLIPKDKNSNQLAELYFVVDEELDNKESREKTLYIDVDLSATESIDYELID